MRLNHILDFGDGIAAIGVASGEDFSILVTKNYVVTDELELGRDVQMMSTECTRPDSRHVVGVVHHGCRLEDTIAVRAWDVSTGKLRVLQGSTECHYSNHADPSRWPQSEDPFEFGHHRQRPAQAPTP